MDKFQKGKPDFTRYQKDAVHIRSMRSIRTSNTEIVHIIISWLAISYAFAILLLWSSSDARPSIEELLTGYSIPLLFLYLQLEFHSLSMK